MFLMYWCSSFYVVKTGTSLCQNVGLICTMNLPTGQYHQYDTIAYPRKVTVSKRVLETIKDTGKSVLTFFGLMDSSAQEDDSQKEEIKLPSTLEIRQKSLLAYLQRFRQALLSKEPSGSRKELYCPIVTDIQQIVKSLVNCYIIHQRAPTPVHHSFHNWRAFFEV